MCAEYIWQLNASFEIEVNVGKLALEFFDAQSMVYSKALGKLVRGKDFHMLNSYYFVLNVVMIDAERRRL